MSSRKQDIVRGGSADDGGKNPADPDDRSGENRGPERQSGREGITDSDPGKEVRDRQEEGGGHLHRENGAREHNGSGKEVHDHERKKGRAPIYLGLSTAFLVAAVGVALSTLPIFLSLPLAALLFGMGMWFLAYWTSAVNDEDGGRMGDGSSGRAVTVATVLIVVQVFIIDIFIFTRMGSIADRQNPIIITWIVASLIETVAAFGLIFAHERLFSRPTREDGERAMSTAEGSGEEDRPGRDPVRKTGDAAGRPDRINSGNRRGRGYRGEGANRGGSRSPAGPEGGR